jgi:hypothetical protein
MTMQLSAGMMQQVAFIGTIFDAKKQLESQLKLWELQERAHEDYKPSEQMCMIATFAQDWEAAEKKKDLNTFGIMRALSFGDNNPADSSTALGAAGEALSRVVKFKNTYCTPSNFSGALITFCNGLSAGQFARLNRNIDYTNLISRPKTLEIDITDGVNSSADEEDVMSMGYYLFGANTINFPQPDNDGEARSVMNDPNKFVHLFQEYRSISAIRNAARSSYALLVGEKASGSGYTNTNLEALLTDFGLPPDEIDRFIGQNPSYYAQREILTKHLFQHPNFYTNLISSEANVARYGATLEAIQLSENRERYKALLRKEMLLSLKLSMKLREMKEDIDAGLRTMEQR